MAVNRRSQGNEGESLAAEYLRTHGFRIVERNYRFQRGEIDIVAEEGPELVFIEVKARYSRTFGPPEDAVTPQKQKQLLSVAEGYLFEHRIDGKPCRFDVVAIEFHDQKPEIRHIRNAF